ncbi:hypothetical protein HN51_026033, partial [Arachis hypogaea]
HKTASFWLGKKKEKVKNAQKTLIPSPFYLTLESHQNGKIPSPIRVNSRRYSILAVKPVSILAVAVKTPSPSHFLCVSSLSIGNPEPR